MDGKNLESVLTEFGTRIHRQVFEHLQQFQYTSIGKQCLFHARFVSRLTFSRFMLFLARRTRLTRSYCKRHTLIMATELCVHCRVFFFFRRNGGDMRYKRVQELYQGVQGN